MQYQRVIKSLFHQNLRVILPPNQRCIKGTFNLCYSYTERESENDKTIKKTCGKSISKRTEHD